MYVAYDPSPAASLVIRYICISICICMCVCVWFNMYSFYVYRPRRITLPLYAISCDSAPVAALVPSSICICTYMYVFIYVFICIYLSISMSKP